MKITNLKFKSNPNKEYVISGEVDYLTSSGYIVTKIDTINGKPGDSLVLRQLVSHKDIEEHIKNIKHAENCIS